jgi:hypothetical protein
MLWIATEMDHRRTVYRCSFWDSEDTRVDSTSHPIESPKSTCVSPHLVRGELVVLAVLHVCCDGRHGRQLACHRIHLQCTASEISLFHANTHGAFSGTRSVGT